MEISVSIEEMRKRKIFVATPMYGGQCVGMYTRSSVDLGVIATKYGMDIRFYYLFNESLITRARNYLADEFLRSGCTHMMFIDSDIGYDPNDVITLAALADENSDKDVICGPYPKKCISWEKVKVAVDKGFADKNPNVLENYIGDYVFNPAEGQHQISVSEPVEVLEGGTGFMMIQRRVFEKYDTAYPHKSYLPDHVRTEHFDGSREIMAYFDCEIDPVSKRYLSEDYSFCQNVRKMGMKVWFCPWMKLSHVGTHVFSGSLADLAELGVAATADVSAIGKKDLLDGKIGIDNHRMVK